jgi:hypothetical protein
MGLNLVFLIFTEAKTPCSHCRNCEQHSVSAPIIHTFVPMADATLVALKTVQIPTYSSGVGFKSVEN